MGVKLSKVTKKKEKMSFGFKHDLFSFALMIMFAFHAINSAFSKCFLSGVIYVRFNLIDGINIINLAIFSEML